MNEQYIYIALLEKTKYHGDSCEFCVGCWDLPTLQVDHHGDEITHYHRANTREEMIAALKKTLSPEWDFDLVKHNVEDTINRLEDACLGEEMYRNMRENIMWAYSNGIRCIYNKSAFFCGGNTLEIFNNNEIVNWMKPCIEFKKRAVAMAVSKCCFNDYKTITGHKISDKRKNTAIAKTMLAKIGKELKIAERQLHLYQKEVDKIKNQIKELKGEEKL